MIEIDDQVLIYNVIHIAALTIALWAFSKYLIKIPASNIVKSFAIVFNVYVLLVIFLVDIKVQPNSLYFTIIITATILSGSLLSKYIYNVTWMEALKLIAVFTGILYISLFAWAFYGL